MAAGDIITAIRRAEWRMPDGGADRAGDGARGTLTAVTPRRHRTLAASAAALVLLLGSSGAYGALGALAAADTVSLPFLLEFQTDRIAIRYTPGSLDRAARVQERFGLLLEEWTIRGAAPTVLAIDLLSRDEWEAAGIDVPYGLPVVLGPREIALAAWGDAGTVALWQRLAGADLPRLEGTPVRGTRVEAESLSALDLAAQVEVARLLLADLGAAAPDPWWDALAAQTLAWSAFLRFESDRADEIGRFFQGLARSVPIAEDRPGGVADRLVAAAPFVTPALAIAATEGQPPAKPFLRWLRKRARSEAERGDRLRIRYPTAGQWLLERGHVPPD